ncbi:MAG: hypoxanthine phosphoribosyltransferase, partial [Chloroflexota bacterium]
MAKPYEKYLKETLIDADDLQVRIQQLGAELTADYAGTDDLLLVCILKGGVMFLTDLMRHVDVPHEIDFLSVSSYGSGARSSTGKVRIDMDLKAQVTGRDVLIVEDIIDTGHTLRFVLDMLQARKPKSLKLCTLLDKPERREIDIPVDYVGFEIENKFVFGYGLDLDEKVPDADVLYLGLDEVEALFLPLQKPEIARLG